MGRIRARLSSKKQKKGLVSKKPHKNHTLGCGFKETKKESTGSLFDLKDLKKNGFVGSL